MIDDFYRQTAVYIDVEITLNGSAPDITGDTVTFLLKEKKSDADADAKINKSFDVAGEGASGKASVELTPTETKDIAAGIYFYEIYWTLSGGDVYVLESGTVKVLERVKEIS